MHLLVFILSFYHRINLILVTSLWIGYKKKQVRSLTGQSIYLMTYYVFYTQTLIKRLMAVLSTWNLAITLLNLKACFERRSQNSRDV
uniref:Uncharacterized protein n=1 Tax=Arundo donax TaxID=35708 RepID=A0A0A9F2K7_ARUDO